MTTAIASGSPPPPPTDLAVGGFDDPMSALYGAIAGLRDADVSSGEGQVATNDAQEKHDDALERAAIQQEQANASNSGPGFLSSVGHFFGDIASDLVHGRFGSAIDDAGRDASQAWNSAKFWSDLETGFEDVALVAGAVAATVMTAGIGGVAIGAGVAAVATSVGAVAGAGAGLARARSDHFAAGEEDASADATAADDHLDQLQTLTTDVLNDLKQSDQGHQQTLQTLDQAIQTYDETSVAPASMTVKG